MASDDEARQKNLERQRLLEEIRKRAEEAELKRIEEEENGIGKPDPPASSSPDNRPADPVANPRVEEIREKLSIALDRGVVDKAAGLLSEFSTLAPADSDLRSYQLRLAVLQENQQGVKVKKRSTEKIREDADRQREQKVTRKKITDLLAHAESSYQQEKYAQALKDIDEILVLDPEHDGAMALKEGVEKARLLADQIKEEEAQRKVQEQVSPLPPKPPQPPPGQGDPWGETPTESKNETVYHPPQDEVVVKKTGSLGPKIEQAVGWLSRIRIPIKPLLSVIAVIILAVAAYLVIHKIQTAVFPQKYSLVIFPATTNVSDGSLDYYTNGLTEDLINDLSVIGELRLIAPTTSLFFQDPRMHNAQTAKALGVSSFIQWNIDRTADEVVIRVSLYDTVKSVWTLERKSSLNEVPALRIEIARAILAQIGVVLTPAEGQSLAKPVSGDAEAYDNYLRGQFFMRRGDTSSLHMTLDALERSLAGDSGVAETHAALGRTHVLLSELKTDSSNSHLQEARRAVQRAIALNPKSPDALLLWGIVNNAAGENSKAIQRLEEAASTAPGNADVHRRLGEAYLQSGLVDEAFKAATRSVSVDPKNPDSHTMLGIVHHYRGEFGTHNETERHVEFDSARVNYERAAALSNDQGAYAAAYITDILVYLQQHERASNILTDRIALLRDSYVDMYRLGRVYQSAGRPVSQWKDFFVRARDLLQVRVSTADADADGVAMSYLALVHTRLGEFKDANAAITRALAVAPDNVDVLYNTARVYTLQKNKAQALSFLAKGLNKRYRLNLLLDMDFFNLQQDAEFLSAIVK